MKRIGMLTSGGDCQALNAAMRGVVKGLSENVDELEVYGFLNGYKGLIYGDYRLLTSADFSGILTKGGTILGSSRQPFKQMRVPDANGLDKVEAMKGDLPQAQPGLSGDPRRKRNTEDGEPASGRGVKYYPSAEDDRQRYLRDRLSHSDFRVPSISPQIALTVSTRRQRPTTASLLLRSWGIKSAG